MITPLIFTFLVLTCASQSFNISILNTILIDNDYSGQIYTNGQLNHHYNDTVYGQFFNCRNGDLIIINNSLANTLHLTYSGPTLNSTNIFITVQPNLQPNPLLIYSANAIDIDFNCPTSLKNNNYYNKIQVNLPDGYKFNFLLDCDPNARHKQFQYGYVVISVINACIIIGVAMHSHIWSIRINLEPIRLELKWIPFLIFSIVAIGLVSVLYVFAVSDFTLAFLWVQYFGIAISTFFVFICYNEFFYLKSQLRKTMFYVVRRCQIMSLLCTAGTITGAFMIQNWILYDVLASCICVGSIKLFYFNTLKQAFLSMTISVCTVTAVAIAFHYMLSRSYNDYATQLSSPLFFQVPDLVNNLYKECSWLPVTDLIIPGVFLSYLRQYDENKSSRYGGIYTVSGNLAFILSTILWVALQVVYPWSIPFSLITYVSLMLVSFLIAWKRNDWKTLVEGTFEKHQMNIEESLMQQKRLTFSNLIEPELLDPLTRSISLDDKSNQRTN